MAATSAVLGFGWLALAMDSHWKQVHGQAGPARFARLALRTLGIAGLAVSAVFCLLADHPAMALLVWVMLLTGTVLAVSAALAFTPRILRALWLPRRPSPREP